MIIQFENYTLGPKVVSLALSEETEEELRREQLSYCVLLKNTLRFWPEEAEITISRKSMEKLSECCDYDVFQINSNGFAYRCFDNTSGDNALMVTPKCNSNCIMCPASNAQRQSDNLPEVDEMLEIVKHMPDDTEHITITGGEPFMVGDRIFEIFSLLKTHLPDTQFLLLTNGRALSYLPYVEKLYETAPNDILIGIPLHGYDAASHDAITRSPGGFEQTVAGIKNLLHLGFHVEIRMVVSKLNQDNIKKIAEYIAKELPGVLRVEIMGLEMLGNAALNEQSVWLPYREAFLASKEAIRILVSHAITVGLYNFPLCAVDKKYWLIAERSITDYKVRFPDKCDRCIVKDACGGIFGGTIRLAGDDVQPVEQE